MDDFYFTAGDCTLLTSTPLPQTAHKTVCVCVCVSVCVCVCGQCHTWDLFTTALNTGYTQNYFEFCKLVNMLST
jgi:hypothetical protein